MRLGRGGGLVDVLRTPGSPDPTQHDSSLPRTTCQTRRARMVAPSMAPACRRRSTARCAGRPIDIRERLIVAERTCFPQWLSVADALGD